MNLIKKKRWFVGMLVLSLVLLASRSWGQDMNITSLSPETSLLMRSVNNPVNLNTGVVNVQIPLFSIQEGGLTLPVCINYQTTGIKLHDIATWVGLGWNLSAGGRISRIVKKRPDETGFCKNPSPDGAAATQLSSWTNSVYDSRESGDFDSEPDVFFYEIGGISGMFVMDPEGNAHTIPYTNNKIEWVDKSYFQITDEKGIIYTFGKNYKEETTTTIVYDGDRDVKPAYVSTWYLETIVGTMFETISFDYEIGDAYEFSNYDETYLVTVSVSTPLNPTITKETVKERDVITKIKPQYLKNIKWKGGYLGFVSSQGRADIRNTRKLDRIEYVTNEDHFIKSINFSYYNLAIGSGERLMLAEVFDSTAMGQRFVAKFDYMPCQIGKRDSKDYDHWGYYNGAINTTNRPTIGIGNTLIAGAKREPVLEYTTADCLKRVYNSLGGYMEYEYELNDVTIDHRQVLIGGLRIKSIKQLATSNDSLITKYYYRKCDYQGNMQTTSSGTIFSGSNYCLWAEGGGSKYDYVLSSQLLCDVFDINGSPVSYSTVIVENPNGSRNVYEYTSNEFNPDQPSKVYFIPPNSSVVQDNYLAVFVNTSRFWRRGLLNKEKAYDKNNNLIHEKSYYYTFGSAAKGVVKGYQTYTSVFAGKKTRHLCEYEWTSEPVLLRTEYSKGQDVVNTDIQYTYDENNLVPVEILQTQYSPYTKFKTTITYPFNYQSTTVSGDNFNQGIAWMNSRHMINYPIETINYRDNFVVGGVLNEYIGALAMVVLNNVKQLKISEPKTTYSPYAYVAGKMVCDPSYEVVSINDMYSLAACAPTQTRAGLHDKPTSAIYGYNNTAIIATVINATVKQIYHTSFEDVNGAIICDKAKTGEKVYQGTFSVPLKDLDAGQYVLTYWKSGNNGITWDREIVQITVSPTSQSYSIGNASSYIDEVRVYPAKALMTTMTYKPGYGKTSETDENGYTVYYEYDGFGRMIRVLDNDRQVLKNYQYTID